MKAHILEWLKVAAPDSGVSVREMEDILGVSNRTIHDMEKNGRFPKHDLETKTMRYKRKKFLWKASTVRNFLRNQDEA